MAFAAELGLISAATNTLFCASNWPFLFDRLKSTTFSFVSVDSKFLMYQVELSTFWGLLCLVAIPLLFFRTGTGVVVGPSGKFRLIGFCHVFTALGISLTFR
jgi:hypothetical protein